MGWANTPLKCGEAATDNYALRITHYALKKRDKLKFELLPVFILGKYLFFFAYRAMII